MTPKLAITPEQRVATTAASAAACDRGLDAIRRDAGDVYVGALVVGATHDEALRITQDVYTGPKVDAVAEVGGLYVGAHEFVTKVGLNG